MNQSSLWLRKSWFLALALWLLTTSPSRADTYAQWAARVFTAQEQADPTISGENANPAGDGVSNLMKFAFDLDPHKSSVAGLPTIGTVNDFNYATGLYEPFLTITHRYPSSYSPDNITYIPEVTSDLSSLDGWLRGENVVGFYDYQNPQNTGDPYLFRYEVISPISQNPAGIFLRVRVVEGHALPAEWLLHYFGTTTGINPDADPDGDGVTTWNEFLNGTDPTDYYNSQPPKLFLVGGGNQRANAGTLLPQPISIEVNYSGNENAPLTFTATGGALLAADNSGNYQPSATINVRSTGQINLNGSQTYVGQVYVYLPTATSTVSTITVTATSANKSTSLSTTAVASDPNTAPPSNLDIQSNSDTYTTLSFTPSDTTLPVSIEVSLDGGMSWSTWGVADPGDTTITLYGLPKDTQLMIRAFTGVDSNSTGGQSSTNGVQANGTPAPTPTSAPTTTVQVVQNSKPIFWGDQTEFIGYNTGYLGFQSQTRYLTFKEVVVDQSEDGTGTTFTTNSTVTPGNPVVPVTTQGSGGMDWGTVWQIDSDTQEERNGTGTLLDGTTQSSSAVITLATAYPLNQFLTDSLTWWKGFRGVYYQDENQAINLVIDNDPETHGGAGFLSTSDHDRYIDKLRYYWHVNKDPNGHIIFDEVFTPKDGSAIKHHIQTWDTNGATDSPVYTLDPTAPNTNNQAEGTYRVFSVELHPDGRADGQAYSGGMVPSNKTDGTGQRHFVIPQTAGGYATIEARVLGTDDGGNYFDYSNFSSLYKFAVSLNNSDVTAQASFSNNNVLYVQTDTANKYVVQLLTNDGNNTVISSVNLWVVYGALQLTQVSNAHAVSVTVTTPTPPGLVGPGTGISTNWKFVATIQPSSIITDPDHPDLTGKPTTKVPNWNATHVNDGQPFGQPFKKWDISRQMRLRVHSPQIGTKDMADLRATYHGVKFNGTQYDNLPNGDIIQPTTPSPGSDSYPSSPIEGNDDSGPGVETDDPYNAPNNGQLTDSDTPSQPFVINQTPPINSTIEFHLQFKEFCRLEIAGVWYPISDYKPWRLDSKMQKTWIAAQDDTNGNGIQDGNEGQMRDNASASDATNNGW